MIKKISYFFLLLGSFALAEEPKLTTKESLILSKAVLLNKTSSIESINLLKDSVTENCSAALNYALGTYLLESEERDSAEKSFNSALKKMPMFHRSRLELIRLHLSSGKYLPALENLVFLLDHAYDDPTKVYKLMGYCHQMMKNYTASEQAYRMALVRTGNDSTAQRGVLQALLDQQRYVDARSLVKKHIENDSKSTELWNLAAVIELESGNTEGALVKLLVAEKLGAIDVSMKQTIASLFFQQELYTLSAERYLTLIEEGVISGDKILEAAHSFLSILDLETARELLESSVKITSHKSKCYKFLLKAQLLEAEQKRIAAITAYNALLDIEPMNTKALLGCANLLRLNKKYSQSKRLLERAGRLESNSRQVNLSFVQLYVDQAQYPQAVTVLKQLLLQKETRSIRMFLNKLENFIAAQ